MKKLILFIFVILLFIPLGFPWWQGNTPKGYWKFNQGSGDAVDSSGNNYDLKNVGVTYVEGKLGNASSNFDSGGNYLYNSTFPHLGKNSFTIAVWVNRSATVVGDELIAGGCTGWLPLGQWILVIENDDNGRFQWLGGNKTGAGTYTRLMSNKSRNDSQWHRIVITRNNVTETLKLYVDGNLSNSTSCLNEVGDFTPASTIGIRVGQGCDAGSFGDDDHISSIDDLQIYFNSWSADDVDFDWNEGNGLEGDEGIEVNVNLISPADNSAISKIGLNFTANYTSMALNLTNATYYLWNSSGIFNNSVTVSLTGTENSTTRYIDNFTLGTYTWNVLACGVGDSDSLCEFAPENYTFDVGATIINQTYKNSTVEGALNNFTLDINYDSARWGIITGSLFYNNTEYYGTKIGNGDDVSFIAFVNAPDVEKLTNISFFWRLGFIGTESATYLNLSSYNQAVEIMNMSLCGNPYTVPFINLTLYDEQTLEEINGSISLTFNYKVHPNGNVINTFTFENTSESASRFNFCMSPPDLSYDVDAILEYTATNYVHKFYNFKGIEFSNETTEIGLYLLNESISTSFIIEVKDASYQPVVGAEVYVQRYDTGQNMWFTSEIVETNIDGKTTQHIFTEDVLYRFKIYDDGELLYTTSPSVISCPSTPCTVTIILPKPFESGLAPFEELDNLDATLTYDDSTNIITFSYIDTSGNFTQGRLYVIRNHPGELGISYVCNDTSSSSTAILTCNLASEVNGTYIATGFITRGSVEYMVLRRAFIKIRSIVSTIGLDGILWSFFILIGILMIGIYRPSLGILFGIVGIVLTWSLKLMEINYTALVAIIGIGIILLVEVRRQ